MSDSLRARLRRALMPALLFAPLSPFAGEAPVAAYPDCGSPVPPIGAGLVAASGAEAAGAQHRIRLAAGRWEIRLRSGAFSPVLELTEAGGRAATESYEPKRGDGVMIPVELAEPRDITLRVRGARADDVGEYLLTVNPAPASPAAAPVSVQDLELRPSLAYPLADGDHSAAPVCLMLEGGKRYRLTSYCENGKTWLLMPAQHGLPRRLSTLSLASKSAEESRRDAEVEFIAPNTGLYVFWCVAWERDFRTRATVRAEAFPLAATLPKPNAFSFLTRASSRQLTVWKRHAFELRAGDPEVFVPCPPRARMKVELVSGAEAGACTVVCADREIPLVAPRGGFAAETVTLPEGAEGIRLRAHPDSRGPALLSVSMDLPRSLGEPGREWKTMECALPAVLRARVKAGDRVAAAVRGAGVSPQIVLRGAGVFASCTDPNGRSPLGAADGVATRDGIVEVLVSAAGAEQGAFASCAFMGFEPKPEGRGVELDLPELAVVSAPGSRVFGKTGTLNESSSRLADGSRVAWFRIPVKAGRTYRVLADAEFAPDLVLDVPGEGKRLAPCGLALLRPQSDGEVTLGLATPGANLAGDYAVAVSDLGPERREAPVILQKGALKPGGSSINP